MASLPKILRSLACRFRPVQLRDMHRALWGRGQHSAAAGTNYFVQLQVLTTTLSGEPAGAEHGAVACTCMTVITELNK